MYEYIIRASLVEYIKTSVSKLRQGFDDEVSVDLLEEVN